MRLVVCKTRFYLFSKNKAKRFAQTTAFRCCHCFSLRIAISCEQSEMVTTREKLQCSFVNCFSLRKVVKTSIHFCSLVWLLHLWIILSANAYQAFIGPIMATSEAEGTLHLPSCSQNDRRNEDTIKCCFSWSEENVCYAKANIIVNDQGPDLDFT